MLERIVKSFDPDQTRLTKHSMLIAVESLKQKAIAKNRVFNCIVLDRKEVVTFSNRDLGQVSDNGYDSDSANVETTNSENEPDDQDEVSMCKVVTFRNSALEQVFDDSYDSDSANVETTNSENEPDDQDEVGMCNELEQWFKKNQSDELAVLLMLLKININTIPNNTRIQLVIRYERHWFSMDINIKNARLNVFLLDSSNNLMYVCPTIAIINLIHPDATINIFKSDLQRDGRNCGYFALDNAYNLSKLVDLYNTLPPSAQSKLSIQDNPMPDNFLWEIYKSLSHNVYTNRTIDKLRQIIDQVNLISSKKLPKAFGSLLKNMQNYTDIFIPLYQHKNYLRHNLMPLDNHITNHLIKSADNSKILNNSIEVKKQKIKKGALAFLNENKSKCVKMIGNNNYIYQSVANLERPNTTTLAIKTADLIGSNGFFKPEKNNDITKKRHLSLTY